MENMEDKKVKASIGAGENKIEFEISLETAKKILNLQQTIRKQ